MLVGEAGSGKGVVIDAARRAWEHDSNRVIGTAVAGATAKRLGADSGIEHTLTADALLHRSREGELALDARTVVVMDEAGMADTRRLAALTEETSRRGSKLVLVGDSAQLASIGPGGLFDRLSETAPSARLTEVYRAREDWEREAWSRLRHGEAPRALAEYRARGRLFVDDTREDAIQRMVTDWDRARLEHAPGGTVMLTDASNAELDRINALAQQRRVDARELGGDRVQIPERPYGVHAGDEVILAGQVHPPGQERVENGTRGRATSVNEREGSVALRTAERPPREVQVSGTEVERLRLAYAQHVYKAQGATVDRAMALLGGWQTDRERAYVALSRARERTDVYVSREDLGEEGLDAGAIQRLGERMSHSRAQQPSVSHDERREGPQWPAREPAEDRELEVEPPPRARRESEVARLLREQQERERDNERGMEIE